MTPSSEKPDALERTIREAVRGLPPRSAPRALERRVLAEIARRAALPWWRKSFAHWPMGARAVFILACTGLVKATLMGVVWLMSGFDATAFKTAFAEPYAWMQKVVTVVSAVSGSFEIVLRNIPSLWLYAGLVMFAAMYATLFGIGAAAYKAIHSRH